ncbi:glycosyltransferase [Sphingorhabdus pulchriflava]|uniref:Glycosyltransferase n=1 Tax=Sphingorhabdus pulchriflava TaxID=2292257 RepID=A0A371BI25_9SPHN|nr:glycosyltransferase family 4 protein [Sphingorhabdus pulchriflava]RDV07252.1 glycosyltransferase [Sphingorhabdus pulchriflava]
MTRARDQSDGIERVVVIHDFAAPEGGAGVLAIQAAQEYRRRGIPVTYFAGSIDGAGEGLDGIDLVGLHASRLLDTSPTRAMMQGFHNRTAHNYLERWIAKNDTDHTVYHLHNWSQILSPAIFAALAGVEDRLVVTCHDFFNICPNGGFTDFSHAQPCGLKPLSLSCLVSQCDRRSGLHKVWRVARQVHLNRLARPARSKATFTFLHDRMLAKYADNGFSARQMVTIPNPVEPWSRARIPAEQNQEFLFVGRLGSDKGADLATAACIQTGVPLTLVGEGELEGRLRETGGDLQLAGWCNRAEILDHARRARALIVPSRVVEPFGLVILEAATSGLPVIVSERAYLAGDCKRLGFGQSFDPAEPQSLTELIKRIANDDAAVEQMSNNGFARADELALSAPEWGERYIGLFRDAIAGR